MRLTPGFKLSVNQGKLYFVSRSKNDDQLLLTLIQQSIDFHLIATENFIGLPRSIFARQTAPVFRRDNPGTGSRPTFAPKTGRYETGRGFRSFLVTQ
jgi:hypothetical protein